MSLLPRLPYKWRIYFHGVIAAIINGVAQSVVVVIADPIQFNVFDGGARKLGFVAVVSGAFGLATYLKAHPLPDPDKDTDATKVSLKKIQEIRASGTGTGDGTNP